MHIVASFTPDSEFTRHSEGAFLRLNDGRIMFAYSRFTNHYGDDAPSDIVAVYSSDEGETWSDAKVLIRASMYDTKNVMSVSLMRMENGDVGLFYLVKQDPAVNRLMLSRSADEGETFHTHIECTSEERRAYFVMNNDRAVRLSGGRILLPLAMHPCTLSSDGTKGYFESRAANIYLYSDDDGFTWNEAPDMVFPTFTNSATGLQEPGVIEKKGGAIWAYARTDKMYQYEYFSVDGGLHWTLPQPSRFTSPASPMLIKRRPGTGELAAVWNPVPQYNSRAGYPAGWGRSPLVYATSADDGLTWSECHVIEDKDDHGYCYPAIFFTDDNCMLVSYCSGGPDEGICLARTSIMKIELG